MLTTQIAGYFPQDSHIGFQSHLVCDFSQAAAVTITTTTDYYEVGSRGILRAALVISAVSGTSPTMVVKFQNSPDASTWTDAAPAFASQNANGTNNLVVPVDRYVRAVFTLGGTTPSFTFTLKCFAVGK